MNEQQVKSGISTNLVRAITVCLFITTQSSWGNSRILESVLRSDPAFSLFTNAMDITDFWARLAKEDSVTLFVPTNQAMEREGSDFLLKSVLTSMENKARLKDLISSHITTDTIPTNSSNNTIVHTLNNSCLLVTKIGDAVQVGSEAFVMSSIKVGKDQLFVIDRLLISDYEVSDDKCTS